MQTLALMGGHEFAPDCQELDRALLKDTGQPGPSVVIVPAAAHDAPQLAAQNGIRYFTALGAHVSAPMLVDRVGSNDPTIIEQLAEADLIYLVGGDPAYLAKTLEGTPAWAAIQARHAAGNVLVGSSAGAMVLGGRMLFRNRWIDTLSLAPRIVVLPHHGAGPSGSASSWQPNLGNLVALGIPEATACVTHDGAIWQVIGPRSVFVYTTGQVVEQAPGTEFGLP